MSVITNSPPVKFFAAVFSGEEKWLACGLEGLNSILGQEADLVSPPFEIVETNYYQEEMGSKLLKVYASWPKLLAPEQLVEVKLAAMGWEQEHSEDGRRQANLDPGYIFSGGLVLSTAKFGGHRLPLGRGIWGELTLNYHRKEFQPFPWTYLDYQRPEIQSWLLEMRKTYMAQMKSKPKPGA